MDREEARRLIKEQICYLTAALIYEDSAPRLFAGEIDQISRRIEALRADLAGI